MSQRTQALGATYLANPLIEVRSTGLRLIDANPIPLTRWEHFDEGRSPASGIRYIPFSVSCFHQGLPYPHTFLLIEPKCSGSHLAHRLHSGFPSLAIHVALLAKSPDVFLELQCIVPSAQACSLVISLLPCFKGPWWGEGGISLK